MSKQPVLLDISDRIATVTLNDPERRNPITGNEMIAALLDTFAKVQADPQVSVMILTGADPAFCAGGDIKEMNDPDSVFRKEPLVPVASSGPPDGRRSDLLGAHGRGRRGAGAWHGA